nr:AAA family ATPase [Propionicimonas sp.]
MGDVPIRRLVLSDFRCIEGTRDLPFDAPVVLIHGPNGTGKTSILSALELALTGAIRSMERQSDRYRAHLPFFGQPYATVRADVADDLQAESPGAPLTVNGARLDGTPALAPAAAKFYSERCYLDQASLGRLLDLYQARSANEQSALEQFVNELLGLEKLDALRGGLSDALDFRLLKGLAAGVDQADREAKAVATRLKEESALLADVRAEVARARAAFRDAIAGFAPDSASEITDAEHLEPIRAALDDDNATAEHGAAVKTHQGLIALSGRIAALSDRPTTQRVQETRSELIAATTRQAEWEAKEGVRVRTWEAALQAAGGNVGSEPRTAVQQAMSFVMRNLDDASSVRARAEAARAQLAADRGELDGLQVRLADAQEHSSALLESLAALRTVVDETNTCPVCDRDFTEIGAHSLLTHIDAKLANLTNHGQQLVALRAERDQLAARVARGETQYAQLTSRLLSPDQEQTLRSRHATLAELAAQLAEIEAAKLNGAELDRRVHDLQQSLAGLDAASSEERRISSELARYASLLQAPAPEAFESFQAASADLLGRAEEEVIRLANVANRKMKAAIEADRLAGAIERESAAVQRVASLAERKTQWDDRVTEAKRRQTVARDVHRAATMARATIVQRVFSRSLNDVWKSVFTRLAPNEGFIPRFGIPSASKRSLDIKLETTHRDGVTSGPPQVMLSAGNLNTAALSLFLALHLAVEPIVPCLVFDDPVQAMDEVHVAQFAGLIRLLAKQNDRQVVIAVHERELFDYLALELSPAFMGDELITIELGGRASEGDGGITRHQWTPDPAIAY